MPTAHNIFYTEKDDGLAKLPLVSEQTHLFEGLLKDGLQEIDEEKYWLSYGRFMITYAPQAYIAWNDKNYWLVNLDYIGEDHNYVEDGPDGIHLFEMTPNKFRYKWCDEIGEHELADLVYTAWDWRMDGVGEEFQKPLSSKERKIIEHNTMWTNEVHARMDKKFPSDDLWE